MAVKVCKLTVYSVMSGGVLWGDAAIVFVSFSFSCYLCLLYFIFIVFLLEMMLTVFAECCLKWTCDGVRGW